MMTTYGAATRVRSEAGDPPVRCAGCIKGFCISMLILSILMLVFGSVALGIVTSNFTITPGSEGTALWGSAFLIACAVIGLVAVSRDERSLLVTYLVLLSIGVFMAFAIMGTSIAWAVVTSFMKITSYRYYNPSCKGMECDRMVDSFNDVKRPVIVLHVLITFMAFAHLILSGFAIPLAGGNLCNCCRKKNSTAESDHVIEDTDRGQHEPTSTGVAPPTYAEATEELHKRAL